MKKRILATLLSLCLVIGLLPVTAMAEEGTSAGTQENPWNISAEGEGNNVTAYLTQNSESSTYTLTISGTGAMQDFELWNNDKYGKAPWHNSLSRNTTTGRFPITALEIGDGITRIGKAAFAALDITTISFKSNVSSYGSYIFIGCSNVTSVDWTNFNANIDTIPDGLLYECTNLTTFKVGDATSSDGSLLLPDTIKKIGTSSFLNCYGLTNIDMTKIEQIGNNAFGGCSNISSITLPTIVSNPAEFFVKSCFKGTAIQSITLPNNLTKIPDNLFDSCSSLASISIPDSVTEIGKQAFFKCTSLKTVTFGKNSNLNSIGQWAFSRTAIEKFDMPDTVTQITAAYAFSDNSSLKKIHISNNLTSIPKDTFSIGEGFTSVLETIEIDVDQSKLTSIGDTALQGSKITSISFPATMTSFGTSALYNCDSLHTIDLTRLSANSVTFENAWCYYSSQNGVHRIIYVADGSMKAKLDSAENGYSREKTSIAITNGGTFANGTTFTANTLATPTKGDYTFGGWYTDEAFSTPIGENAPAAKQTYYAKWVSRVTLDANEGTVTSTSVDVVENGAYGETLPTPTRTGYTFQGWYTAQTGGDKVETSTVPTGNTTLYAQWEINKYDVTFNSDGGSAVDKQTVEYNTNATVPANPTKEGYAFAGWYNGENVFDFENTSITSDLTLTAKWNAVTSETPKFTVTFNSNGGSAVAPTSVYENAVVAEPAAPTREGYTFAGWLNGTAPYNFNAPVTADLTLTAKWDVNTYTVTWDVDGTTTTAEYTYGAAITLPTAPTKDGYTFTGWSGYTNGMTMPAENVTFTAQWQQIYYGGGSSSSSNTSTSTTKNPDGSTTTTTTNKTTGVTTETTKLSDGTTGTVVTDKNGNITEVKASVSSTAVKEAAKTGEAVILPVEVSVADTTEDAPAVQVTVPKSAGSVKVEIPVEKVTPGTVAVIVKADGTEEIVKTSTLGEDGVVLKLDGSATVKVIDNAKDFSDTNGHWAEDAISFVTAREMFAGTSATTFTPNSQMTRAQLMTVLARFDGVDTNGGSVWYEKGMEWAKANGVSDGSNPNGSITREQLATMLWRFSGSPVVEGGVDSFNDAGKVSGYATDAMRWAVETGLIGGIGNNTLAPQGNATRAQLATILMRYCENLAQ